MASRFASTACLTLLLFMCLALLFSSLQAQGARKEEVDYVPVQRVLYRRRSASLPAAVTIAEEYEPFQLCDGCRCCAASNSSNCVDTSCCYAIDCDIPGKPFGFCAFTPHTCGCGANNCTQQPS